MSHRSWSVTLPGFYSYGGYTHLEVTVEKILDQPKRYGLHFKRTDGKAILIDEVVTEEGLEVLSDFLKSIADECAKEEAEDCTPIPR
jgi:hypothetical protein